MEFGAGLGLNDNKVLQSSARQIDYWVDAALGSNSNNGTFDSPLRTFQEAVNRSDEEYNAGFNNIFLKPGEYDGAYINDNDMLKVFGTGANPWDVSVTSYESLSGDAAIYISGGSDVRLFNINVNHAYGEGIYAYDLDYLFLNNVVANDNYGAGLYVEYVSKVKIYNSSFFDNHSFGARGYDVDHFRVVSSNFDNNYDGGAFVDYGNNVEFINSSAQENYEYYDEARIAGYGGEGDGLRVEDSNSVLVNGGNYSYNDDDGIDINDSNSIRLLGVHAAYNDEDGADMERFYSSAQIDGGLFEHNGENGVNLEGAGGVQTFSGQPTEGPVANIYGGQYYYNYDDGVDVQNVYAANLYGIDARHNDDDGIDAYNIGNLFTAGGYLYANYDNGLESQHIYMAQHNDLVSNDNGEDGLETHDGYKLNIIGGSYSGNSEWGIHAHGEEELFKRVDIKFATVLDNYYSGANIVNSYLAKVVGGTYSNNYEDGLTVENVHYGIFTDVVALNNGDWGLHFDTGRQIYGADSGSATSSLVENDPLYGDNWNRLEFLGGLYKGNGYDGIYVSTDRNRGYSRNVIEMQMDYVVARDNGFAGLNVGGNFYDANVAEEPYYAADLHIEMTGGYYGFNQYDGIYLLGVDNGPLVGLLEANLTDVVAEFNGWNGVKGSGVFGGFPGVAYESEEYSALIDVVRGVYGHNGYDGLNFNYYLPVGGGNQEPLLVNDDGFYGSLASFTGVVAVANGDNGLNFGAVIIGHGDGDGGGGGLVTGETEYPALLNIQGGVYNLNGYNGIKLTADVFDWEENVNSGYGIVGLRATDVEASVNGNDGLNVKNFGYDYFRPDVEIIRGVYNSNHGDGIYIRGMGYVSLNQVVIIANDIYGLHSRHNTNTSISDNSVIVANGVQNVLIN